MTTPKRWDLVDQGDTALTERPDGDYVTFEDYEVVRGNLSQMEVQRDHWLEIAREKDAEIEIMGERIAQLQGFADAHEDCEGEIERLRKNETTEALETCKFVKLATAEISRLRAALTSIADHFLERGQGADGYWTPVACMYRANATKALAVVTAHEPEASHYCIDCNEAHDPRTCGALKSGEQS